VARRASAGADELREYHESPPAIVRDMEQWLAVGDRQAAAERVRRWLVDSYELAPAKVSPAPRRRSRASTARRSKKKR